MPKLLGGMSEEDCELPSSLRDEVSLFATKEAAVRPSDAVVVQMGMEEGMTKFSVKCFAILVVPTCSWGKSQV